MKKYRVRAALLAAIIAVSALMSSCGGNNANNNVDIDESNTAVETEIKTLPDPTPEELADYAERIKNLKENHSEMGLTVEERGENAIKATNFFGFAIEQGGEWVDFETAKILPVPSFKNPFLTYSVDGGDEVEIRLEHVTPDEVRAYCETTLKEAFSVESFGDFNDEGDYNYFAQHENGSTVSITAYSNNTAVFILEIE